MARDAAAQDTFDFIVAGAGSAGCVLANRLSANPANRVLLLEAGGRDWNPWIHVPVGYFKTLHNPATDWCYKTDPDPGLNGRSLDWPRGKTLGGSSSINGLLYIRGQHEDYDHWRQLGNAGWSSEDTLPYFKRAEDQERGGDNYHGAGGPLSVSDMRVHREVCNAFIEAAEEIGVPRNDDFNGKTQEGAGYFQLTSRHGRRCSTAVGYLNPVRSRPNLEIVTHAHVEQLLFDAEDQRAVRGIRFNVKGTKREAHLKPGGEIVLSAGAIGSPQILQVSGIGPGDLLQDLDIPVRHNLPGVGENLQDHLQIRMVYEVNVPTLNDEINNFFRRMLIGAQYVLFRRGAMAMGASQVCIFAKTRHRTRDARYPVPFPTAQCRQTRYRDAFLLGDHLLGLSAEAGEPGKDHDQIPGPPCLSVDPARIPIGAPRSRDGRGGPAHVASAGGLKSHVALHRLRAGAGSRRQNGRRAIGGGAEHFPDDLPSDQHLQDGKRSRGGGR